MIGDPEVVAEVDRKDVNYLAIVLDLAADNWRPAVNGDVALLSQCIDAVLALANAHVSLSSLNNVVLYGCDQHRCRYLYPVSSQQDRRYTPKDGQYEIFAELNSIVKREVKGLIALQDSNDVQSVLDDPLIPAALSKCLCYFNRVSKNLTMAEKFNARILIITPSGNLTTGYMAYMNAFFSAQKLNVIVDSCLLGPEDSGLLRQGCDITGGIYFKLPPVGLLQNLIWLFLPGVKERKKLALPERPPVDYRASCFCHHNLVEVGFVCSVCLSVFCKFSPICSTCHSVFNLAPIAGPVGKAKKRKVAPSQP